jgi:division protein CdvB (Snf7/Vps24/ESCRT-III family)
MSKLNDANERLDAALAQLEAAVTTRRDEDGQAAGAAADNARLQNELTQLRADFVTLQETSGTVSSRLDDAVGRIRNMLAE